MYRVNCPWLGKLKTQICGCSKRAKKFQLSSFPISWTSSTWALCLMQKRYEILKKHLPILNDKLLLLNWNYNYYCRSMLTFWRNFSSKAFWRRIMQLIASTICEWNIYFLFDDFRDKVQEDGRIMNLARIINCLLKVQRIYVKIFSIRKEIAKCDFTLCYNIKKKTPCNSFIVKKCIFVNFLKFLTQPNV